MKNISSIQMINIQRTTFNEKNKPLKNIYAVKINGDVPASHRMVQSELNAIYAYEEATRIEVNRKRQLAKAAEKAKTDKIIAQKEAVIEEGKKMNSAKRKKFYHKKKVNNYVRHQ